MTDRETPVQEANAPVADVQRGSRTGGEAVHERRIDELGHHIVRYLFSASKTVQIHDLNNQAAQKVLAELAGALGKMLATEGRVCIRIANDFIHINDTRITVDPVNYGLFLYLMDEMKRRKVEQIEIAPGITVDELGAFLRIFFGDHSGVDVFGDIERAVAAAGVVHVKLAEWIARQRQLKDTDNQEPRIREESNKVFFRSVLFMAEVLKSIEQRRIIQVRKAERLVQRIFDIIQVDESILVGLTHIKNLDEYTYTHSVNVCVLSMLIGERLKLHKADVARLGVAALLHDIGKMYIPEAILNKPGTLDDREWELMKLHTMFGVKELSRTKSLREIVDSLYVALQHHIQYNMNGYPRRPAGWDLPLFPRIVTIADYYDAMTTVRIYHRDPLTPDKAVRFIFDKMGTAFDPLLARVFINAIGIYPNGTVVALENGEVTVVMKQNRAPELLHRPTVIPVSECAAAASGEHHIDLAEKTDDGTAYRHSIVGVVDDARVERSKANCFLDS